MNNVQIFQNNQFGQIRVATTESGEPLFCLSDLCQALSIANPRNVRTRLDDGDVHQMDTPTTSGIQQITFVTEPGMYDVILRSDSPKAKPMQKWVTSEVLPSIRKHGAYMTSETLEKALTSPDFLIQLATNLKEEKAKRIEAEQQIETMISAVIFTESVKATPTDMLVGDLAKIIAQNGIDIGQNRLYDWLVSHNYLIRRQRWSGSKQKYSNYYMPTQRSVELNLFRVQEVPIPTAPGEPPFMKFTCYVTGRGQEYFIKKFLTKKSA